MFGDQFVKRILHREDVILAKLDCTDQNDGGTQNNVSVGPWKRRDQRDKRTKGEEPQRHVPHVGITQVHTVFDVAHDEVARGDEDRHEELRLHRAIKSKDCPKREDQNHRADEQKIDKISIPWTVASQDRVAQVQVFTDRKLIGVEKLGEATGQKDENYNAKEWPENCSYNKLARNGSELKPAIREDEGNECDPDKKGIFFR